MSEHTDRLRDELLALRGNDGLIDPAHCVSWAGENPKSDLHAALCWDDAVAAQRYRIWQVRTLIAIKIVDAEGVREFVSLSTDRTRGGGYREAADVLHNDDLMEILLSDGLDELERLRRRFGMVPKLAPVWTALERTIEREKLRPAPKRAQKAAA